MTTRLLILGGSSEASALARALAARTDVAPILSLAGATRQPLPAAVPSRSGGFGGIDGLARYLRSEDIAVVVDATHPFAARMSHHAAAAAGQLGLPLLRFTRAAWRAKPGDRWIAVAGMEAAVTAIGVRPRRVFVTSGRQGVHHFAAAPQHHYLIRAIDPPPAWPALPTQRWIFARGPFAQSDEAALLDEQHIDCIVTKNSGGHASEAKLKAARQLGVEVIMIERPILPDVPTVEDTVSALAWIDERIHGSAG